MGFPRQEYWSGLPFPSPRNLPDPEIKPTSLTSHTLAGRFFTTSAARETHTLHEVKVLVAQSCLTLCDPMDCSPPGSSVHGISQARILEWVVLPFIRGPSQCRDQTQVSHIADGFFYHLSHQGSPHSVQPFPSSQFPTSSPKVSVASFTNLGPT